jgi:hypothetical protein
MVKENAPLLRRNFPRAAGGRKSCNERVIDPTSPSNGV